MRKALLAAALLLIASPALADGYCESGSPTDFAVEFKLQQIVGEPLSGLDALTLKQLGDRHWKLRQIDGWTDTLAPGAVQSCYREWLLFYLSNIEAEVRSRSYHHAPDPDPYNGREQEAGHRLLEHLPSPK